MAPFRKSPVTTNPRTKLVQNRLNALSPAQANIFRKFVGSQREMTPVERRLRSLSPEQQSAFRRYVGGINPPPIRGPVNPDGSPVHPLYLPAADENYYSNQRNQAQEMYQQALADNTYQRGQTGLAYAPQFRDLAQQFADLRNAEPSRFVDRGILGSGIQHDDLQRLAQARVRAYGDLSQRRGGALSAIDLARSHIERQRALALSQIANERQRALAAYAARYAGGQ